ncbi:hypothetical protein U1Q18_009214 [Sarracenia purpurea var. burkii]
MLGNSQKKMVLISSTTTEWPQNQIDEKFLMASTGNIMEKPINQNQNLQTLLKCPRCDSSNTKFCYYNNYSLSQPRHFCKACKRYWTRGGTLRNVPVGGGCRKNKRVKRATSAVDHHPSSSSSAPPLSATSSNPNNLQPHINLYSSSNHVNNPLFYGLPTNPSELTLPYPRYNSRVLNLGAGSSASSTTIPGFDLQSQLNALGLGFSSGIMASDVRNDDYRNGFNPNNKQFQDVGVTSSPFLSSHSMFGSSSASSSPSVASMLASSLQRQKFISNGSNSKGIRDSASFHELVPYEDLQMAGNGGSSVALKEMKMEEGQQTRLDWSFPFQNQIGQQVSPSDPSLYWNATNNIGAWLDPAIHGSSAPSLI